MATIRVTSTTNMAPARQSLLNRTGSLVSPTRKRNVFKSTGGQRGNSRREPNRRVINTA